MFRRNNIHSKNNGQPADEKIREESRTEQEILQKTGNQNAGNMPPLLPPNVGNEAMNEFLNDHYAENMLNIPPLINSGLKNKNIDEVPDMQTQAAKRPGKKQKQSGRHAGKQSAPFKANAPLADLTSPGMKLNMADKPNIDEILRRQREFDEKFKIIEKPHDDNSNIKNMNDDESDRFIKIKNDDQSETSNHNDKLKLIPISEEDSKHPVNKSLSGGMPEGYEDEGEINFDKFYSLDPDADKKIRKKPLKSPILKNGKIDLTIPDVDIFASDNEEENGSDNEEEIGENDIDTRRSVTKRLQKEAKKKKKPSKKEAPKEEDDSFDTYAIEEDLVPRTGPKNGKNNRRNRKHRKKAPRLSNEEVGNLQGIEEEYWKRGVRERSRKIEAENGGNGKDSALSAEEMDKIKNWNFQAQKLDEVNKPSKLRRFLTYAARGAGNLLGAVLQIITLGHFWRARSQVRSMLTDRDSWQQERDRQTIPGWEGAKYDSDAAMGENIMADFRRVPTVWSHLTAAKASETVQKNGEEVEKPLDPVVSVLIDQPKSGSTQATNGKEEGHAMISIEYSRKSLVSNRYERYKVQYGFYPAQEFMSISPGSVMMRDNAVLPGILQDDAGHDYDISRRYPAKPAQVNAIFEASENYADGGYSVYDRNCATFVKEMVVNTAHLATGGDIFKESEGELGHLANFAMVGAEAFEENTKAGVENAFMNFAREDADTYDKFGGKKATKKDWDNYKKSTQKITKWNRKAYVPGEIAERMRRMEGEGTGEVGTKKYSDPLKDEDGDVEESLMRIKEGIDTSVIAFQHVQTDFMSDAQMHQAPTELFHILGSMDNFGQPLVNLENEILSNLVKQNNKRKKNGEDKKLKRSEIEEEYYISTASLRTARQELSENVSKTSLLLYNYYKNDKRVHNELMNIISLLNYAIEYVDNIYEKSARGGMTNDNHASEIRDELTHEKYTVKAGNQKVDFTPTHYESYIQIYKSPEIAVEKYHRLLELRKMKEERGDWLKGGDLIKLQQWGKSKIGVEGDEMKFAEAAELKKLEQLEDLALQFDNAHNYMVEKEKYSQQDIDYAFQLNYREKYGNQKKPAGKKNVKDEDFRDDYKSASGIYITLMLDKIFPGLKEAWMKDKEQGGLSMAEIKDQPTVYKWLDNFFMDHINSKKKDFQMIIRGLYRAMKTRERGEIKYENLRERVADMLKRILVERNFKMPTLDDKVSWGNIQLQSYCFTLGKNNNSEFSRVFNKLILACLKENMKEPQEKMVFD